MNSQKARKEAFKRQIRQASPEDRFQTLKYRPGGEGRIVVVTRRIEGGDNYHMGIAFCSPRDQYNKLKGQAIALGRMLKDPIEFERAKDRPVTWSVAAIAVDIAEQREVRWMRGIRPEDLV